MEKEFDFEIPRYNSVTGFDGLGRQVGQLVTRTVPVNKIKFLDSDISHLPQCIVQNEDIHCIHFHLCHIEGNPFQPYNHNSWVQEISLTQCGLVKIPDGILKNTALKKLRI